MIKILLDFTKLTQDEFKTRLEFIFKKMNGNATYSMFEALIATLGAMTTAYSDALFIAKDGGDVSEKNKLRTEGNVFLTKFAAKIQSYANDLSSIELATAFAKGTGFTVQEAIEKAKLTFLAIPSDFIATDDSLRKGVCLLEWTRVMGALTYLIEMKDKDGNWQNIAVSKLPKFTYLGTESGVLKTFRIRAIGAGSLLSDFTEAVSVWVR